MCDCTPPGTSNEYGQTIPIRISSGLLQPRVAALLPAGLQPRVAALLPAGLHPPAGPAPLLPAALPPPAGPAAHPTGRPATAAAACANPRGVRRYWHRSDRQA